MNEFKKETAGILDQKEKGIMERSNERMQEIQMYIETAIAEIHKKR